MDAQARRYCPKDQYQKAVCYCYPINHERNRRVPCQIVGAAMSSWKDRQQQLQAGYGTQEIIGFGSVIAPQITRRQQDVLIRFMAGMSNKEIARDLDLGVGTVKIHVAGLYRRLGVKNRTGAAAVGMRMRGTEQCRGFGEGPTPFPKNYAVKYHYDFQLA
jgi:DNA-binding NarL/FixJ family response regulator